jgi:CRISPR-associated protein Cas1
LIAQALVSAKIANSRTVLLRAARETEQSREAADALDSAALKMRYIQDAVSQSSDVDMVRGHEGEAASLYFAVLDHLITVSKDSFFFARRSRRPPLDNVNSLLSFLYTLLAHDCCAALESVGLDPQVGFLHCERPGRPSLALDLMEELRPVLADRLAVSLINRRQIKPSGFRILESGGVVMDDETRKQVLIAWQQRKQEEILHPFIQERIPFGLVPYVQALLLARFLRGDLDGYPPFFWR